MFRNKFKRATALFAALVLAFSLLPFPAMAATTVTPITGVSVTDSVGTGSLSGTTVTITATGSYTSRKTNTVTITNTSGKTATVSFDFALTGNYNSYTFDSGNYTSTSGTCSKILNSGASVTFTFQSQAAKRTATLTLSNFSIEEAAASSNVTFNYDDTYGSITVAGTAKANDDVVSIASSGAALVATPASGATFHGWVNAADGSILSTSASYTLQPASDMTVKAVFTGANSLPYWGVGSATQKSASTGFLGLGKLYYYTVNVSYIFDDLNTAAAAAAESSSNKVVTLLNDGTLSAGTYTIPSGVTLLIPFDSANTMYTTQAQTIDAHGDSWTEPKAYRTLTMANGANLIINGAMSVPAKTCYANGSKTSGGSPTAAAGYVSMDEGSTITVNGQLYAYGFITGFGTVVTGSSATIYECFQIMDFRGGTQSTDMQNGVFPFSQYYVQNIEVPLTINCGASLYGYTTFNMSSAQFGSAVCFIGPSEDFLFQMTSGSATKTYDGTKDRLIIDMNGEISVSPISLEIGGSGIDTADYEMAINGNLTLNINSGGEVSFAHNMALLPGVQINISEGTELIIGSEISVFTYDTDQWGTFCGATNKKFIPVTYAPGRTYDRTEADLVDAAILVNGTLDASNGGFYTTSGGANIYSTGSGVVKTTAGTQTITHQLVQNTGYTEIPITPAKLKHGDGTYLNSATDTYNYNSTSGKWECTNHSYTSAVTAPTCTAAGYTTYTCTACGDSYTSDEVAATGHSYESAITTAATCTTAGVKTFNCSACGDSYTETIPATGHTPNADDGDCTTPITCSVCGTVTTAASAGHVWDRGTVTTEATATTPGVMTYECTVGDCTQTKTEEIPATGEPEEVISVTITWGSMNFVYTKGAWDPETHTYTVGSITPEDENANVITITNGEETNVNLTATLAYTTADSYTGAVTGSLSATSVSLPVSDKTAKTVTLTLSPGGAHATNATVGKVTVTITKSS